MSHFPILIQLVETGTVLLVDSPEKIPSGITFKVIQTGIADSNIFRTINEG